MTGATGDLTPDEVQQDLRPGEWREASGASHRAAVTRAQAAAAPAQRGETGDPGGDLESDGPTELATRESGYGSEHGLSPDDPAYRMETRPAPASDEPAAAGEPREPRLGGDDLAEHEERL